MKPKVSKRGEITNIRVDINKIDWNLPGLTEEKKEEP